MPNIAICSNRYIAPALNALIEPKTALEKLVHKAVRPDVSSQTQKAHRVGLIILAILFCAVTLGFGGFLVKKVANLLSRRQAEISDRIEEARQGAMPVAAMDIQRVFRGHRERTEKKVLREDIWRGKVEAFVAAIDPVALRRIPERFFLKLMPFFVLAFKTEETKDLPKAYLDHLAEQLKPKNQKSLEEAIASTEGAFADQISSLGISDVNFDRKTRALLKNFFDTSSIEAAKWQMRLIVDDIVSGDSYAEAFRKMAYHLQAATTVQRVFRGHQVRGMLIRQRVENFVKSLDPGLCTALGERSMALLKPFMALAFRSSSREDHQLPKAYLDLVAQELGKGVSLEKAIERAEETFQKDIQRLFGVQDDLGEIDAYFKGAKLEDLKRVIDRCVEKVSMGHPVGKVAIDLVNEEHEKREANLASDLEADKERQTFKEEYEKLAPPTWRVQMEELTKVYSEADPVTASKKVASKMRKHVGDSAIRLLTFDSQGSQKDHKAFVKAARGFFKENNFPIARRLLPFVFNSDKPSVELYRSLAPQIKAVLRSSEAFLAKLTEIQREEAEPVASPKTLRLTGTFTLKV